MRWPPGLFLREQFGRLRLIAVEQSRPLKLELQVMTRPEFPGGRERHPGYRRPLSRTLASGAPRPMKIGIYGFAMPL
jgi:hypothetical protein